jgi:hypothetical protein
MPIIKRVLGLTLFSVGAGMLLVLLMPGWGWILAFILVMLGFNFLMH